MFALVHIHMRVFRSCLPTSLSKRWAKLATHGNSEPHFVRIPCSYAHFDPLDHRTCVIAKETGPVSIGAHMQQDIGISEAPPRLGAPFPLFDTVHVRKRRSKKIAITSSEK